MASLLVSKLPRPIIFSIRKSVAEFFSTLQTIKCATGSPAIPSYMDFSETFKNEERKTKLITDMKVIENFLTDLEEKSMLEELEPCLSELIYEKGHWDNAIQNYREIERLDWSPKNQKIIDRVMSLVFEKGTSPLKYVHVLDLDSNGVIMQHVDSVKFCGNTIAGISLLSDSVMRLRLNKERTVFVDVLLKQNSLYIMTDEARYDYTHEILGKEKSSFKGVNIQRHRRISVIFRNEPKVT